MDKRICNGKYIFITNGTCTDDCGPYFYPDNTDFFCKHCVGACAVCNNNADCESCDTNFLMDTITRECYCPAGFFTYLEDCGLMTCNKRCVTSANCPLGTFGSTVTNKCEKCGLYCQTCTAVDACTGCQPPYLNNGGTCGCDIDFILLLNGTCIPEIKTNPCEGKPFMWVTNASCTNDCGDGFYLNAVTNFCLECTPGCATCVDP